MISLNRDYTSKIALFLLVIVGVLSSSACHRGFMPISSRGPTGPIKPGSMYVHKRSDIPTENPEIFVKSQQLKISEVDGGNETGSLVSPDDRRIYLFQEKLPYRVGETVLVKVTSRRLEKKSDAPAAAAVPAADNTDELTKELLGALPRFDAGDTEQKVLDRVPFRITHVEPNGDAYGFYERQSRDRMDISFLKVSAKIPFERLLPGEAPSTDDLSEVRWLESRGGEIVEQQSSAWEDEYSLRVSGFSEARSKIAMDLEKKQGQLTDARNRLKNQIVSFASQRKTMTEERARILSENSKQNVQMEVLAKELRDKEVELAKLRGNVEPTPDQVTPAADASIAPPTTNKLPAAIDPSL